MPAIGGLAMFAGFIVAFAVSRLLDTFDQLYARNSEPRGIILAATIIVAVGLYDDIKGVSPPAKVTATVLAGIALVHFGATMYYFRIPFVDQTPLLSDDWMPLITVLWLLGMTQAINLIDGLDGLAAGHRGDRRGRVLPLQRQADRARAADRSQLRPAVAIIAVGVCVGFLPHNFNPARIIMGDSGALLLGLLLAVSSSVVGGRAEAEPGVHRPDVLLPRPARHPAAGARRADLRHGRSPSSAAPADAQGVAVADKGHLHHRLMNLGHGHRRSVLILWAWTALLSGFVLYPVLTGDNPSYLPFGMAAIGIGLFTYLHPSVRRRRRDNGEK